MGYDLSRWAQHAPHPCLTARTRQVLSAICMVAHDEHGEFWMRGQKFVDENLPGMTYGAYRNHLSALVRNGLLLKVEHGGGSTSGGRGTTTRYRVNSPVVMTPHPEQGVLPDIPKSSQTQQAHPEVSDEQPSVSAIEVHQRVDELLAAGITTEQMVEILKAVSETLTSSPNLSEKLTGLEVQTDHEAKPVRSNLSGNVTSSPNMSEKLTGSRDLSGNVTGFEDQTCQEIRHVSPEPVRKRDKLSIHEEKKLEEKDEAAAANLSGFFEILATALADSGYPGVRAAQFADLTGFLQDYANLTGSPPDQRTADYIAGRVSETTGIRNVAAFVRRLAHDVLTTGEGYAIRWRKKPHQHRHLSALRAPCRRPTGLYCTWRTSSRFRRLRRYGMWFWTCFALRYRGQRLRPGYRSLAELLMPRGGLSSARQIRLRRKCCETGCIRSSRRLSGMSPKRRSSSSTRSWIPTTAEIARFVRPERRKRKRPDPVGALWNSSRSPGPTPIAFSTRAGKVTCLFGEILDLA